MVKKKKKELTLLLIAKETLEGYGTQDVVVS